MDDLISLTKFDLDIVDLDTNIFVEDREVLLHRALFTKIIIKITSNEQ